MKAVKKILTFLADMSGKGGGEQEGKNCLEFSEFSCFKKLIKKILTFLLICPLRPRGGGLKALADMSVMNGRFF